MSDRRSERLGRGLVRVLLAAATCLSPRASRADEPAASPAAVDDARAAFNLGAALAREERWLDALSSFERSARLRPHAATTFNIGYCERALGHYIRARARLLEALDEQRASGGTELTPERSVEIDDYLREIERKLARAVVTVAPGARISVDGRPLQPDRAPHRALVAGLRDPGPPESPKTRSFDLLLDPGTHVFLLAFSGAGEQASTRTFEPGSTTLLDLSGAREPTGRAPAPRARTAPFRPRAAVARRGAAATERTWGYVALGVGGAFVVGGATFGVLALGNSGSLQDDCPTRSTCPRSAGDDIDALDRNSTLSTIGFALGLSGLALGAYLVIAPAPQPGTADRDARRFVAIGPGVVRGAF